MKTKPKLPKAYIERVPYGAYSLTPADEYVEARLPAATKAQARMMVKAHKFLALPQSEQEEQAGAALYTDANWSSTWAETTPQVRNAYKLQARAVLATIYGEAKP